jgi:hypothetical protein
MTNPRRRTNAVVGVITVHLDHGDPLARGRRGRQWHPPSCWCPPSWATTWRRAARWAVAKSNACRVVLLGCAAPGAVGLPGPATLGRSA